MGACFGYLGVLILAVLQGLNFKGICEQMGSFWLHFGYHFGVTFAAVWRFVDLVFFFNPSLTETWVWGVWGCPFSLIWALVSGGGLRTPFFKHPGSSLGSIWVQNDIRISVPKNNDVRVTCF